MIKYEKEQVELIHIVDIISNQKLNRTINDEDIKRIADSIESPDKIVPIIVMKEDKKYQWVTGQEVLEAFRRLGKKKIPAIVRDFTEDEACEFALATHRHHTDVSSEEHEDQVNAQWERGFKSGRYKTITDFSKRIGYSDRQTSDLIRAKKDREKIFDTEGASHHISTETLRTIKTLTLLEKRKFCDRIKDKKISPVDARDVVRLFGIISDEQKEAILNGDVDWRTIARIVKNLFPKIKEISNILKSYHTIDKIKEIIESEKVDNNSEPYRLLANAVFEIEPIYIENIKSETHKKQAILYKKLSGLKIFRDLYKLGELDKERYNNFCKTFNIKPETIENLVDDGHYYFLPDKQLTNDEKRLKDELQKLFSDRS